MNLTAAEYKALNAPTKKGRYGSNKRIKTDEGNFDSKGEYSRWCALKQFQKRGEITELERQVEFPFIHNDLLICIYVADFTYAVSDALRVEDFKGRIITPEFRMKWKMMEAFYGITVRTVTSARADIR
jgi:hypothetical protein